MRATELERLISFSGGAAGTFAATTRWPELDLLAELVVRERDLADYELHASPSASGKIRPGSSPSAALTAARVIG